MKTATSKPRRRRPAASKTPGIPRRITIVGIEYRVVVCDDMVEVDVDRREVLWGQADFHGRTIRLFRGKGDRERSVPDMLYTLLHEIGHCIFQQCEALKACLGPKTEHEFIDEFASIMADTLVRNRICRLPGGGKLQ